MYTYSLRKLLAILHPYAPEEVHAVRVTKRQTKQGLLTVGLKLHCLDGGPQFTSIIEQLGGTRHILEVNHFRRTPKNKGEVTPVCWVLPPVGNVEAAIKLVEALEVSSGTPLFGNPKVQIQVCTPGRLSAEGAAFLSIGFCLGSDRLRILRLSDLETTFSDSPYYPRGRRITLYDAGGTFDRQFAWWGRNGTERIVSNLLPFKRERTDVLSASTERDLRNINLFGTILVHEENGGYWKYLGTLFREEMRRILNRHKLGHVLDVSWIRTANNESQSDFGLMCAIGSLMVYAFKDAHRISASYSSSDSIKLKGESILIDTQELIAHIRALMVIDQKRTGNI